MPAGSLTERDEAIACWVARMEPVTVPQVVRRFALSRIVGYRRVKVLREFGYLERRSTAVRRPGQLVATDLAHDLAERTGPARSLAPHQLAMHLAVVDLAIDHELAGTPVLTGEDLAAHPALEDRLPSAPGPLRPELLVLGEKLHAVYAPTGAARRTVAAALVAARWSDGLRATLLVDAAQPMELPGPQPPALELREVDLATAGAEPPT